MNWRKPVIYALLHLTGSKIPANLRRIKSLEKMSPGELKVFQEDKLKKLLLHSYKNVPYYHRILRENDVIDGKEKVNLDNFDRIPTLTKDIIRREGENLYSKDYKKRKYYENTSGGSTGEPVKFIQDKYYDDWNIATKIYFKTFVDQKIGDKELRLWGSERDILEGREKASIRLRNWLYNRQELNSFRMSDNDMFAFVEKWNTFKPRWIEAYVQSIYEFGKFIKDNDLSIYLPKGVLTSAGTLYPEIQTLIEDVFQCKVFNRYGSREVGGVACNCGKSDRLHVAMWHGYVEILNEKLNPVKPDEMGKIYITTLNNFSMPLIRYDIGDIAVKAENEQCSCGRGMALIKKVEGREISVFRTKEGKIIPGEFFIHFIGVVFNEGFISKFQVIQKKYDLILLKLVIQDKIGFNNSKNEIINSIKKVMGQDCKVEFEFVDDIKPLKSGKYLYTVSEVK